MQRGEGQEEGEKRKEWEKQEEELVDKEEENKGCEKGGEMGRWGDIE